MSILTDLVPPKYRKYMNATAAAVFLVLGSLSVAGVNVDTATAVALFVASALNLQSYANINTPTIK